MSLPQFFFYIFSTIAVVSALMVISSRNPVYSVLFLILVFLNAAGLFLLAGAEFLALLLVVVYVGAVMAVLFLFVVMMLDVDFSSMRQGILQYMPIGVVIGVVLLLELLLVAGSFVIAPQLTGGAALPMTVGVENTRALGLVIYTRYAFLFEAAGAVLLVAMIGAIVLTLRHKVNIKRQDPAIQAARRPVDAMKIVKVRSGEGL